VGKEGNTTPPLSRSRRRVNSLSHHTLSRRTRRFHQTWTSTFTTFKTLVNLPVLLLLIMCSTKDYEKGGFMTQDHESWSKDYCVGYDHSQEDIMT